MVSFLYFLMHDMPKLIATVKPVKGWNKRSLQGQKVGFKKTCYEVVAREFSVNTPETCDSSKKCRKTFDREKR